MSNYNTTKTLICVSSVHVWGRTAPKRKGEDEEVEEGDDEP